MAKCIHQNYENVMKAIQFLLLKNLFFQLAIFIYLLLFFFFFEGEKLNSNIISCVNQLATWVFTLKGNGIVVRSYCS